MSDNSSGDAGRRVHMVRSALFTVNSCTLAPCWSHQHLQALRMWCRIDFDIEIFEYLGERLWHAATPVSLNPKEVSSLWEG